METCHRGCSLEMMILTKDYKRSWSVDFCSRVKLSAKVLNWLKKEEKNSARRHLSPWLMMMMSSGKLIPFCGFPTDGNTASSPRSPVNLTLSCNNIEFLFKLRKKKNAAVFDNFPAFQRLSFIGTKGRIISNPIGRLCILAPLSLLSSTMSSIS